MVKRRFFDISVPEEIYRLNRSFTDQECVTFEDLLIGADVLIPRGQHKVLVMDDGCGSLEFEGESMEIDYFFPNKEKNVGDTLKNLSEKGYLSIIESGEIEVEEDE